MQLPLPLRFRYTTVKGQQFINTPPFATSPSEPMQTNEQVKQLVQMQESFVNNMKFYLQKNDLYKLTQDADFQRLLQSLLRKEHSKRPRIKEILSDRFVTKWTKH